MSLMDLAASQPIRELAAGETLIAQGDAGGDLFILEDGELSVQRDGIRITAIARSGSLVGEMSVVLGTAASATVRASIPSTVRVIRNARAYLAQDQELTFRLAHLMAVRLDATSELLVDLTRKNSGSEQQGWLTRIFAALNIHPDDSSYATVARNDMFGGANDASRE
jgi:CRP/FNR family cyclic AMP-dependent transcriptional regulator